VTLQPNFDCFTHRDRPTLMTNPALPSWAGLSQTAKSF